MARIDTLGHFLTDVADAIRTKTGDSNPIQASNFDTAISNIPSGGTIEKIKPLSLSFQNGTETSLDLSNILDGSRLTSFIFKDMKNLKTLNLSGIKCTSLTSMQYFCSGCTSLETINLTGVEFSAVTNLTSAFTNCTKLTSIDLSSITSAVTNTYWLFNGCSTLTFIDISGLDLTILTNHTSMFGSVPQNCEIIVKDSASKTWMQTNFAGWSNVKTKAEYEAE